MYAISIVFNHVRAVSLAVVLGLCGGLAKGRFVLSKTALRNKRRIAALSQAKPWQIFAPSSFGIWCFFPVLDGFGFFLLEEVGQISLQKSMMV